MLVDIGAAARWRLIELEGIVRRKLLKAGFMSAAACALALAVVDVSSGSTAKGTASDTLVFGEEPTHRGLFRLLSKAPSRAWYRIGMRRRQMPVKHA